MDYVLVNVSLLDILGNSLATNLSAHYTYKLNYSEVPINHTSNDQLIHICRWHMVLQLEAKLINFSLIRKIFEKKIVELIRKNML